MTNNFLFFLIILLLPTQLGRHFWPDYTHVLGIRVDYLSPTLYLTDLMILLLFINWSFTNLSACRFKITVQSSKVIIFLLSIGIGIIFSSVPQLGLYGYIKLLEFIFFGYYTAHVFKLNTTNYELLTILLSIGVLFESSLAIAQYINHGSLQGVFYFFGERAFNSQTPGIANASINGELILRPYATFSHPNILAGYLLIVLQLIIPKLSLRSASWRIAMTIILGSIALFLTMSRIAIIIYVLVLAYWFILKPRISRNLLIGLFVYLLIGLLLFSQLGRFTNIKLTDESITQRADLNLAALLMFKDHPIFGIGLNNFLTALPNYMSSYSYSKTFFIQPAHNIYLLVLAETGIVGFAIFGWFIFKTIKIQNAKFKVQSANWRTKFKNKNNAERSLLVILLTILIIGMFDHYFLTINQGQLLFSFILGLCYNKSND